MEAAHTGPSNVTTAIIIISNVIITLLLLQASSEPNDGVQQPDHWESLSHAVTDNVVGGVGLN